MKDYQKETIETYNAQASSYQSSRAKFLDTTTIDRFLTMVSGKTILDMGCGPGRDTSVFVEKGYEVVGIDLAQSFVDIARGDVPGATFRHMDVLDLKFPDETFDGIWCNAVLLHLIPEDIEFALKEAFRVLKPGGTMYVSMKKGEHQETIIDPRLKDAKRFFSYVQKDVISKIFTSVGFEIVDMYENSVHNTIQVVEWINAFVKKTI